MTDRTKTYLILVFLVSCIIFSFSIQLIHANAKQKELIQRDVLLILNPLIELKTESVGASVGASCGAYDLTIKIHYQLLTESLNQIKDSQRKLPLLSRVISLPLKKINTKKLKKIQNELDETQSSGNDLKVRVNNASKTSGELLNDLQKLLSKPITILRDKNIPDGLREKVNKALDVSHNKTKDFALDMDNNIAINERVKKAEFACLESRRAISLSLLVSLIYEDFFVTTTKLDRFWEDIERLIYYNNLLCKSLTNDLSDLTLKSEERSFVEGTIERLELYSQSEHRRQDILQAIIDDDMQKAQELLLVAMRKAISEENSK